MPFSIYYDPQVDYNGQFSSLPEINQLLTGSAGTTTHRLNLIPNNQLLYSPSHPNISIPGFAEVTDVPSAQEYRVDYIKGYIQINSTGALNVTATYYGIGSAFSASDINYIFSVIDPTTAYKLTVDQISERTPSAGITLNHTLKVDAITEKTGSAGITFDKQIKSILATGTAPLSVQSATKVTTLNADQVDGADLDTDTTLAANSDVKIASQKAIKTYADNWAINNNYTKMTFTPQNIIGTPATADFDTGNVFTCVDTGVTRTVRIKNYYGKTGTYVIVATGNSSAVVTIGVLEPGTITTSNSSTAVTGVGTKFTQLAIGRKLYKNDGTLIGTISAITDDLNLVLSGNAASTNSGIEFFTDSMLYIDSATQVSVKAFTFGTTGYMIYTFVITGNRIFLNNTKFGT